MVGRDFGEGGSKGGSEPSVRFRSWEASSDFRRRGGVTGHQIHESVSIRTPPWRAVTRPVHEEANGAGGAEKREVADSHLDEAIRKAWASAAALVKMSSKYIGLWSANDEEFPRDVYREAQSSSAAKRRLFQKKREDLKAKIGMRRFFLSVFGGVGNNILAWQALGENCEIIDFERGPEHDVLAGDLLWKIGDAMTNGEVDVLGIDLPRQSLTRHGLGDGMVDHHHCEWMIFQNCGVGECFQQLMRQR